MRLRTRNRIACCALALLSLPATAHHSLAGYDMQQVVSITGTVTEIRWTSPHVTMVIAGWTLESLSPAVLERRGWHQAAIEPGDELTVALHPLKNGEPRGLFLETTTPDGTLLRLGGDRIRRGRGRAGA